SFSSPASRGPLRSAADWVPPPLEYFNGKLITPGRFPGLARQLPDPSIRLCAMLSSASTPAVSVIIPTFRREDCIEATLDSVFAQTFRDFEVIVINDGSPDGTAARLRPWVESGKIRYYEQPNGGQSAARNRGISLARGE